MSIEIVETTEFEQIVGLEQAIPEFASKYRVSDLEARLAGRPHLCLLALDGGRPVGYKLGYQETPARFYSWIGAVLPECRGLGIARGLLHRQEAWVKEAGYREIDVWSENRYRGMMIFLLKENYDIFAVAGNGKVLFRKVLG
jgi:GNAT superfamily N-acetyltransferase